MQAIMEITDYTANQYLELVQVMIVTINKEGEVVLINFMIWLRKTGKETMLENGRKIFASIAILEELVERARKKKII